jgi:hypothetical protein
VETPAVEQVATSETLKRKGMRYYVIDITPGVVNKQQVGVVVKTCGVFAKDWPGWLTFKGAFDLKLD